MQGPRVSIITTTHNLEDYIGPCIESVLEQTYSNWEQIVVDDGSTDGTAEKVRSFKDPRIRFIQNPHRGILHLGDNYNEALERASGEVMAVLEGDDLWPPEKLERQVPLFSREDVVLTWGNGLVVDDLGRPAGEMQNVGSRGTVVDYPLPASAYALIVRTNIVVPAVTMMFRRDALLAAGGFWQPEGIPFVDYSTWLRLVAAPPGPRCFRCLNEWLGFWRRHPAQESVQDPSQTRNMAVTMERFIRQAARDNACEALDVDASRVLAFVQYLYGRASLKEGRWSESFRHFRNAVPGTAPREKALSLAGMAGALFRVDPFRRLSRLNRGKKIILKA